MLRNELKGYHSNKKADIKIINSHKTMEEDELENKISRLREEFKLGF